MADISNTTLSMIVGIALVVSLVGLFSLPNGMVSVTGLGTTGEARLNITQTAALNVTRALIDFGNGSVEQGKSSCTLSSDTIRLGGNPDPNNCFFNTSGTDGPTNAFLIENVGNVQLNVTISSTKSNASFFGTNVGTERYGYKCSGNGTAAVSTFAEFNATAIQPCVTYLNATAGQDVFTTDINITIPDVATGFKNDTITFTGSMA